MKPNSIDVAVARNEDAPIWIKLQSAANNAPLPVDLATEIEQFRAAQPEIAEGRMLGWLDGEAVACCRMHKAGCVVDLRGFYIEPASLEAAGAPFLRGLLDAAWRGGTLVTVVTVEYPREYSSIFRGAGFREGTRTRMKLDLATYEPRSVTPPAGVTLRHPRLEDEPAAVEMVFRNYEGTADGDMVSSSREQAEGMIRAMFGSEYSAFRPDCSYLAEDAAGIPVGDVLTGDVTRDGGERTLWILDISLCAAWRGRGLGKALLASALNRAKEEGFVHAGLIVTIGNESAHALYRSFGLRDYGELMYEGVLKADPRGTRNKSGSM